MADDEIRKAFGELQMKMMESKEKIKNNDLEILALKKQIAATAVNSQELGSLPPATKVYEGAGRMFLLTNVPSVTQQLESAQALFNGRIKALETGKEYLEKSVKESENNLRELITQKQGVAK